MSNSVALKEAFSVAKTHLSVSMALLDSAAYAADAHGRREVALDLRGYGRLMGNGTMRLRSVKGDVERLSDAIELLRDVSGQLTAAAVALTALDHSLANRLGLAAVTYNNVADRCTIPIMEAQIEEELQAMCTGARDDDGTLSHDGDTCPVHEHAEPTPVQATVMNRNGVR